MISSHSVRGWRGKAIQFLGGSFAIFMLSVAAFSQGSTGRILGTVTDQSGGVVAGATVSVIDTLRGVTRTLTTDDAGEYNAPNLTPGGYTVRAEAKGFKTIERQNIMLEVAKEVQVDLTLQPGERLQTIVVTAPVPMVDATNATLGGTLDNSDILNMPLNGRNYQDLLGLRPGVVLQPGGGPWSQSTNNVRPDETFWMVDGVINSNFYDGKPIAGMQSPITDGATVVPIDSIQEFNVMEDPKAEYGWKPGAVVNVGIKSGTNQFHGSAYAFGRDAAWDARNLFNPAPVDGRCLLGAAILCDKLPTQLEQFGGSVGGPIKKDKLFYFANYEGLRSLIGNALVGTGGIPETVAQSTPDPATSMVDAITALQQAGFTQLCSSTIKTACISPVSLALGACTGTATVAGSYTCSGLPYFPSNLAQGNTAFISNLPNTNTSDNGVGKINYQINGKNTLTGLAIIGNYVGSGEDHPFVTPIFLDNFLIRNYTATGTWVYSPNSTMVNEVRFGYGRMEYRITDDEQGVRDPIDTGLSTTGLPDIYITGFNFVGTWHNRPQSNTPNPYEDVQDSFSYLKGKHALKFGYEYAHMEADSNAPDYSRGRVNFTGGETPGLTNCTTKGKPSSCPLEDFFAGNPNGGTLFVGNANRSLFSSDNALFVQDDWHVAPTVTLNGGMRWSYQAPWSAAGDLWANFDPTSLTGLSQQGSPGNATMWKPDYLNFSPRVGFAWDIFGQGKTVVRGGFSVMYSTFDAVEWLSQGGFKNDSAVSLAANPSGDEIVYCPVATCQDPSSPSYKIPTTIAPSGSIVLKAATVHPTNANWNGVLFPAQANPECGDGIEGDPSQCDIMGVDPNLKTPYVMNFNLGIQHQFANNFSWEVNYVGNRGERLTYFGDVNQVNPATSLQPYGNQFPWLNYINVMTNQGYSNYNSLQTTLTKRLSHGLSFTAGYTYGHALDDGSLNRYGLLPQDSAGSPTLQYASSDYDVRNRLTLTATYNIPGIKGHAQVLEGWQINTIVVLQSAQPWEINDTTNNFSVDGKGDTTYRWNFSGIPANFKSGANSIPFCDTVAAGTAGSVVSPIDGVSVFCTQTSAVYGNLTYATFTAAQEASMWAQCRTADPYNPSIDNMGTITGPGVTAPAGGPGTEGYIGAGCFVNGNAVMTPPNTGTFGDMGRNIFRDDGFRNMDFSVFKNFTFKERYNAQFRLEIFNLFNHPTPANPWGADNAFDTGNDPSTGPRFGGSPSTPDGAAGNPIIGSGGARDLQVGLKITF